MNDASVALAARLVVAAVLTASALAKLQSRGAVQREAGRLVNERLAPLIGPALPVAEIVVAVGLVAWWGPVPGVVALVLLATFTIVLVRAQARHVPCMCFGASQVDRPVGPMSVMRNGYLAALAAIAIGDPSGAQAVGTIVMCVVFGTPAALLVRASR